MATNIQRRRTGEEIIFNRFDRPRHCGPERRLQIDDDLLALRWANRHTACRGCYRCRDQAMCVADKNLAERQCQNMTGNANHERLVWRGEGGSRKKGGGGKVYENERAA